MFSFVLGIMLGYKDIDSFCFLGDKFICEVVGEKLNSK